MSDCGCSSVKTPLKPVDEALALLLAKASPLADTEALALGDCLGRVLAGPVVSALDVPPWDNSAMDGYALRHGDLAASPLTVAQRIPAGASGVPLAPGTAARIFTGAPVPGGADTVVMQEVCRRDGDLLWVDGEVKLASHIRRRGEDIRAGSTILEAGLRLEPQHLGLAASVGLPRLIVRRRLRVAVLSSGDELAMPGEPLSTGQIYNSNAFVLEGLLTKLGAEVIHLGRVADQLEATCAALQRGAEAADLIVASGGVSVGEEDHVKQAVERLGRIELWKLAIRPGKPLAFGYVGETPFIGAPGNPVSLFVIFVVLAAPLIRALQGLAEPVVRSFKVRSGFVWDRPDSRREYLRARLITDTDGEQRAEVYPSRSSAVLTSVTWSQGLVIVEPHQKVQPGDRIAFLPYP